MSRGRTVDRIIRLMPYLLEHYKQLQISENHPRYSQITDYRLLRFLYVLADILEPLRLITKQAQSNKLDIVAMLGILRSQKAILQSLKTQRGVK